MRLSRKSEYALLALARLANGKSWSVTGLSRITAIPTKLLEPVLNELRRAGFVQSTRGPKGGYIFDKDPASVSIGEIIHLFEGNAFLLPCTKNGGTRECLCEEPARCPLRPIMTDASDAMEKLFGEKTIEDLARACTGDSPLAFDI